MNEQSVQNFAQWANAEHVQTQAQEQTNTRERESRRAGRQAVHDYTHALDVHEQAQQQEKYQNALQASVERQQATQQNIDDIHAELGQHQEPVETVQPTTQTVSTPATPAQPQRTWFGNVVHKVKRSGSGVFGYVRRNPGTTFLTLAGLYVGYHMLRDAWEGYSSSTSTTGCRPVRVQLPSAAKKKKKKKKQQTAPSAVRPSAQQVVVLRKRVVKRTSQKA
jgi:hypothetical protein